MVTDVQKDAAWERASTVQGKDSAEWRKDEDGTLIRYSAYGNTNSDYGWEIDHRNPVANGGTDHGRNLRALHWKANRKKGANY